MSGQGAGLGFERARVAAAALSLAIAATCLAACGVSSADASGTGPLRVVATTPILADLVTNVAGPRAEVSTLVPTGADPHNYEPTLRDLRDVVYAQVAFSNHLLLEQQSIISTIDANLPVDATHVSLAEGSSPYGVELIPLVEDRSLDTIWLGMRVLGDGSELGADRSSTVSLSATSLEGPGQLWAYVTESFGRPSVLIDSSDGFDERNGYRDDTATLPPAAHTHLSWAFSSPGIYRLELAARLQTRPTERPIDVGTATVTIAVGVDPSRAAGDTTTVLDRGHADLAVDLDAGEVVVVHDPEGGGHGSQRRHRAADVVVAVPNTALHDVPPDPQFRFLGRPGTRLHQLPQAVLGRHVHGEIDPHLWHDVRNAMAYVQLIRDTLVEVDPSGALDYRRNAAAYLDRLDRLDAQVRRLVASIPAEHRQLVSTHDAFGYLAHAYDLEIAGVLTPSPSSEPSMADRGRLADTITNLEISAVFLEPNLLARSSTLVQVAEQHDVEVCPLLGDTFAGEVRDYVAMMRHNARSLQRCLGRR